MTKENQFAKDVIKNTIKQLRAEIPSIRVIGKKGHIAIPIPDTEDEITMRFQICFGKLVMICVANLLNPGDEKFIGLDMSGFDDSTADKAVLRCLDDLKRILYVHSNPVSKEEEIKPEAAVIRRITHSAVVETKEVAFLSVKLDQGMDVFIQIPAERVPEYKEGSLVIDHGGKLMPYQRPTYLN